MSGTPVFAGTRVPVQSLWDHLEAGDSLDKFLDSFPSVSRRQAKEVLKLAGELLIDRATEGLGRRPQRRAAPQGCDRVRCVRHR